MYSSLNYYQNNFETIEKDYSDLPNYIPNYISNYDNEKIKKVSDISSKTLIVDINEKEKKN